MTHIMPSQVWIQHGRGDTLDIVLVHTGLSGIARGQWDFERIGFEDVYRLQAGRNKNSSVPAARLVLFGAPALALTTVFARPPVCLYPFISFPLASHYCNLVRRPDGLVSG